MNALHVLAAQHRAIGALFDDVARAPHDAARRRAVSLLAEELIAHLAAEDAVFYPRARRALGTEAAGAPPAGGPVALRLELRRLLEASIPDPLFEQRLMALRALFDDHVADDEGCLFPRVERAFAAEEIDALGDEIEASRPVIWVVTTAGRAFVRSGKRVSLRSRLSLPIPAAR